jgi:hypothetical protein
MSAMIQTDVTNTTDAVASTVMMRRERGEVDAPQTVQKRPPGGNALPHASHLASSESVI